MLLPVVNSPERTWSKQCRQVSTHQTPTCLLPPMANDTADVVIRLSLPQCMSLHSATLKCENSRLVVSA